MSDHKHLDITNASQTDKTIHEASLEVCRLLSWYSVGSILADSGPGMIRFYQNSAT